MLSFSNIVILSTVHFSLATSVLRPHSGICGDKKCTDIDFENNCENENCPDETEERVVVCYFTNWAWYRSGVGKYTPSSIDPHLCTHINYAFAILDNETLTIKSADPWADYDNHFYHLVTDLIKKGVKILLSIGGWNNSEKSVGWSRMFANETARAIFIKSVVDFLKLNNFHGLDVDYEYPACPQANSSEGCPEDASNFNKLIYELQDAFKGKYSLSVTVAAGEYNLNTCYDIQGLCRILDWINVMAYDYHVSSEKVVGANAPMCGTGGGWGVYETLCYLTKVAKCSPKQLVMGIPFYGQSFTLEDKCHHTFGAKAIGPGEPGMYTKNAGTLSYYEICLNRKSGWKTGWSRSNDSWAFNGTQFVSYDSTKDIKRKCCLIRKAGMKGALIWALDYDDFTNACGGGKYPLLTTLNHHLRGPSANHY